MNEVNKHPIVEMFLNEYPMDGNFTPLALKACLTGIRNRIFEHMKDEEETLVLSDWSDIKTLVEALPDSLHISIQLFMEEAEAKYAVEPESAMHFVDNTLHALRDAMKRFRRQ